MIEIGYGEYIAELFFPLASDFFFFEPYSLLSSYLIKRRKLTLGRANESQAKKTSYLLQNTHIRHYIHLMKPFYRKVQNNMSNILLQTACVLRWSTAMLTQVLAVKFC